MQTPQASTHVQSFLLGVEGQGVGELLDCFVFVNADNRWWFLYYIPNSIYNDYHNDNDNSNDNNYDNNSNLL